MNFTPAESEYNSYFQGYISKVPEGDPIEWLRSQGEKTRAMILNLTEEQALHRYAEGKWSLKEVIGHIIDCERIFAYRSLCIARGDGTPLPGFNQDAYVSGNNFDARSRLSLADEFYTLRQSSLALFSSYTQEELERTGTASGNTLSTRAAVSITVGHELHHLSVIEERYLS